MSELTLYIGTKNTSSWSLRAWLMLKLTEVNFETIVIELDQSDTKEKIMQVSPSGRVPVLKHKNQLIWDSLAIGEYLAEIYPHKYLWPKDFTQRAEARSLSCEMHAGFSELRKHLPMNIKKRYKDYLIPQKVSEEIQRIIRIWTEYRSKYNSYGKFLFGDFTIADAMFAPVATRFVTYDVKLSELAMNYVNAIMEWSAMKEWCDHV